MSGEPEPAADPARAAVLRVLGEASEPLHWTVVQDRALTEGLIDPFEVRDVRKAVLTALAGLAAEGSVAKVGKGVYRTTPSGERPDRGPARKQG